jgi:outer membrane protein OmpA-like peptidoglycan-associated protein
MRLLLFLLLPFLIFGQGRKRLPPPINETEHIEYAPSISADGRTLIFQSDKYGLFVNAAKKVPQINAEGRSEKILDEYETNFFGIYEVKLHPSGEWMKPNPIGAINEYAREMMTPVMGGPSISYDGNILFFFANFGKSGYGREDIFYSIREKNGWSKPINIGSTINTDGYEGFPSVSPDGKRLYFTREIVGKNVNDKQCYRIMVSEKGRNGKWKEPFELPPPINFDCEKAPRIMADSRTLVFSSIKKGGKGDFDLYKAVLQDNGTWSEPIPLEFINTKKSDLFVAISPCGDLMYFVSNGDIYTTPVPEELRPFKIATIQGFVVDSLTKAPISAKIVVKDRATGQSVAVLDNNPSDGRFTALVPITGEYELSVNLSEFFTKNILIAKDLYKTCEVILQDFLLQKLPSVAATNSNIPNTTPKSIPSAISLDNKPTAQPKAIEEMELVADSPTTQSVKISAEGQKPDDSKLIVEYALILKIVDKETNELVANPQLLFTDKETKPLTLSTELLNNELYVKVKEGDEFGLTVEAKGFLPFKTNVPKLTQDKRITIKLAKNLPSLLNIVLADAQTGQPLSGHCRIKSATGKETVVEVLNGKAQLPLSTNDNLVVTGEVKGYLSLSKTLQVELPTAGNKIYDLDLRLVSDEYFLTVEVYNIETARPIPNARFYVLDQSGKRIFELTADASGKAKAPLPSKGNYAVECIAEGFQPATQTIKDVLHQTIVQFKVVPLKQKTHELKLIVLDAYTGEELHLNATLNGKPTSGPTPFFVKGVEGERFELKLSGDGFQEKTIPFAFVDSLINRANLTLRLPKSAYEFDLQALSRKDRSPIAKAQFKLIDLQTKLEIPITVKGGKLNCALQPSKQYSLQIKADGFEEFTTRVETLRWVADGAFEQGFLLTPTVTVPTINSTPTTPTVIESKTFGKIEKGKSIILKNIYFDQSSPVLRTDSYPELDALADVLAQNPTIRIEIRGHTDNVGDFDLNVKLSKERCQSVEQYLIKKGIQRERLQGVGRGSLDPIAPNTTEENKKKNRRVEFVVL